MAARALVVLTVVTFGVVQPPARAQVDPSAGDVTPPAGALVVALRSLGQVNAVLPTGEIQVLARGLAEPSGVAVLDDGTVLVAETGGNRVSGFGGRLGAEPELVAAVPQPSGLAVGPDGSVYATAAAEVGRIDMSGRQYQTIAAGFALPTGPAVRDGVLYVPDFASGEVISIDVASGSRLGTAATGLRSPGGVASAAGLPLLVSEASGNNIVRVDPVGGAPSQFATVQGPLQLSIDPATPSPGESWTVVAATTEGVVRLDADGRVVDRISLPLTVGATVAPRPAAAEPTDAETNSEAGTTVLKDDESSGGSSLVLIIGLVLGAAVVAVVATLLLARRAGRREREGDGVFAPPPDEPANIADVFSGCGPEEMEVDRLQQALRTVSAQRQESRSRARDAVELASQARDRTMRALEVRTSIRAARLAGDYVDEREKLTWAQLSFTTNEGRAAFDSFRRRDLTASELRLRLTELGEIKAVAQIVAEGRRRLRADPNVPWPEEREAVHEAAAARDELHQHEHHAEQARVDAEQLDQHERVLTEELAAANQRLDDCRRGHQSAPAFNDF